MLEKRQLLAAVVVDPIDADLISVNGSYLESDSNGINWYNGSGLSDATMVETGDPVPAVWPTHLAGHNAARVSRIRNAPAVSTLTFNLGGSFDITGMALWNCTEAGQSDRGFENTVLSYSTDGGLTYSGSDALTWTQLTGVTTDFGPEVKMLPATRRGVTHVRMNVDNFSAAGSDIIVMASEIRFTADLVLTPTVANVSVKTVDGQHDLRQGQEGTRDVEVVVTLSQANQTGSPITFDLTNMGGGTATSGLDFTAIAAGTKVSVPNKASTVTHRITVLDDFLIEATETLRLRIANPNHPTVTIGTSTAVATIADNDTAGVTLVGADTLAVAEQGQTDTYTIGLNTVPTGAVRINVAADPQLQVSLDGVIFASSLVVTFTDRTVQTVTVRATADQVKEGLHSGTIRHTITGPVVDPNYPAVTVESLYTQTGTDPSFDELISSGALPDNTTSTAGVTGSTINVNNTVLEQGPYGNRVFEQNTRIHTLGNSSVPKIDFPKWSRWYQEDGRTQIYRIFEGEENTRNDRELAARIESFESGFDRGVWNDFSARYTIAKPVGMAIFQSFEVSVEWSTHINMSSDGDVSFTHRRGSSGGQQSIPLAENMIGKSFDILVRDNGTEYQVYFNGELKGVGTYTRTEPEFAFRWGMYRGGAVMTNDALIFISGATTTPNTSTPVGLVPYRPATTALSIPSATAAVSDPQFPFVQQSIQSGTRILAEQFDLGGAGIAYFDTTPGNQYGGPRIEDDVDLNTGSIVLGNIVNGEWLEFTRDIVPGIYNVDVQAWSNNTNVKGVRLLVGLNNSTAPLTEVASINIPDTGNVRLSHTIPNVDLTAWAGTDRVLRIEFFGGNFSYDWVEFKNIPSSVVGRGIAYGGTTASYGQDAIDPSKSALLPGETASVANFTNYSRGLNRLVLDVTNLPATGLTASDFIFRVGNTADPSLWTVLSTTSSIPLPTITTIAAPLANTSRVTLAWPNNAIQNTWLQVTMRSTLATALSSDDIFYFGNARFDVTPSTTFSSQVVINVLDTNLVRARNGSDPGNVSNIFDVDKSGAVNVLDTNATRAGNGVASLRPFTAPSLPASLLAARRIDSAFVDMTWLDSLQSRSRRMVPRV